MKYNEEIVQSVSGEYDEEKIYGIDRRYLLKINLNKEHSNKEHSNKSILFIMMNPAGANDEQSDSTIQKAINYVFTNKCSNQLLNECNTINIVNAYVVYTKNPEEVTNIINQYGEDYACGNEDKNRRNDKIIKEQIEKNHVIIFSCGKGDIKNYESRIEHLKKILKDSKKTIYSVGELTKDGFPRHMSRVAYKFDLKEMQV